MKKNTVTGFMLLALALSTGFAAQAQTPEQMAEITKSYDLEELSKLRNDLKVRRDESNRRTLELAEQNGWPLKKEENGRAMMLHSVTEDNKPIYKATDNLGAATTARVSAIRSNGSLGLDLNGQGMIIGMFEIGYPRPTHQELAGRIVFKDGGSFSVGDANSGDARHATHVAGTIIGAGVVNNARGIAYQAEKLWSYDAFSDDVEAADAAAEGLLISNHSYGIPEQVLQETNQLWRKGAYTQESADWDAVMRAAPYYQAVISAGNDRSQEETHDLIGNKTSKNAIVVAAVNQVDSYVNKNSVQITGFSSYGPTNDRRIKPDIAMKGADVYSSVSSGNSNYDFESGTSMAAPGVAGTLALLQQHYHNLDNVWMRAATLRGLMIHTADEAGNHDGPDHRFGWGLINATKAVQLINNREVSSEIDERELAFGQTFSQNIVATGTEPLRVTIVWTDFAGNPVTQNNNPGNYRAIVNDLDVRVTQGENTFFPYKLNSTFLSLAAEKADNNIDNVEVVDVGTASGNYTVTVSHKGTLRNFVPQPYTLIISGGKYVLAVTNNDFSKKVAVYPNPANDVVNIAVDASIGTEGCSLAMYDIQGRLVKQYPSFAEQINVADLSAGIYTLHINKDGITAVKKIIKE